MGVMSAMIIHCWTIWTWLRVDWWHQNWDYFQTLTWNNSKIVRHFTFDTKNLIIEEDLFSFVFKTYFVAYNIDGIKEGIIVQRKGISKFIGAVSIFTVSFVSSFSWTFFILWKLNWNFSKIKIVCHCFLYFLFWVTNADITYKNLMNSKKAKIWRNTENKLQFWYCNCKICW